MSRRIQLGEDLSHGLTDDVPQNAVARLRGAGFKVIGVAATVALGGFLVGFDAAVISGAVPFIRDYFGLEGESGGLSLGWAVSSLGWGAMAGNLAAGVLSDRLGRKTVLLLAAALFFASSLTAALSTSFTVFVIARICGGLAVGAAILTAPVYIAEIAPARIRGSLVSLNQLMIVIGISVSFFSNYSLLAAGADNWRWMLGVQIVPASVYFLLLMLIPESPRWLLSKGREQRALEVLTGVYGGITAQRQLMEIRAGLAGTSARRFSLRALLTGRMRRVMIFGVGIAFFQQATGINAIFYYLPTIFTQAGGGLSTAFGQSVFIGLVNVGMTFAAIWLIDSLGRKPLLCIGLAGMTASLLTISCAFHGINPAPALPGGSHITIVLLALAAFVASFAISLGPVMWVLLSEIFPNEQRAAAIGVVGFWNSLVSATVTLLFPREIATWGPAGTFLMYGLIAGAGLLFIAVFAPETKGKTLEELACILTSPKADD